ncbi:hypothetical protein [Amorphus sp. 3PC139-8]|uniref:hypothetical protein n=1 Tax=Amorphus sp. 3PC139-8 TaxID=2735676 RepID=UPI00345DE1EE
MTTSPNAAAIREAVGVFESAEALRDVIDELLSSGFDRAALSLLAAETAINEKLGYQFQKIAELEDNPIVPRCCYVSTESIGDAEGGLVGGLMYIGATVTAGAVVASGGTLALVISAAALAGGVGGLFGALLAGRLGAQHAQHLQEQLDHGGLLLWVRTWTARDETRAVEILSRHSGRDVHIHTLPDPGSTVGGDHLQETLDEALDETFPASDPLAMLEPTTNSDKTKTNR